MTTGERIAFSPNAPVSIRLAEFSAASADAIVGRLITHVGQTGITTHRQAQIDSWRDQVEILRAVCTDLLAMELTSADWTWVFEFLIPRRAKRIDAVLLTPACAFVIEFKIGESKIRRDDLDQAEEYGLELADFHLGSRDALIFPLLVPSLLESEFQPPHQLNLQAGVARPCSVPPAYLARVLRILVDNSASAGASPIEPSTWPGAPYRPTPTIVEAARTLYAGHDVTAIAQSEAGAENLTATQDAVIAAVEHARELHAKTICFVTGTPGAGKTLAGLNVVNSLSDLLGERDAVFLSGNGPLVKVLVEALARDERDRTGCRVSDARRMSGKFVQNVHRFIDHYSSNAHSGERPHERVLVFDEAQRAWNAEHSHRKFKRLRSEPSTLLEIMDRFDDWAVVIALVGGGQEINTGEGGLQEWGRAISGEFPHWKVLISNELLMGDTSTVGQTLFWEHPTHIDVQTKPSLHLNVSTRTIRTTALGDWVNAVVAGDPSRARSFAYALSAFPIVQTRSLERAREWLRENRRGVRQCGLVASSGARRLRQHGVIVDQKIEVEHYFLNDRSDVRSASFLELVATEFDIQGLELDWIGLCWDADLRWEDDGWGEYQFKGHKWQRVRADAMRQYIRNKYRVLMTRAREGMVIWVPPGDERDETRSPTLYDPIAESLGACGIPSIDD